MPNEMTKWRKWANMEVSTEPLCGVDMPEGKLPPVSWFCAKLNRSSTTDEEIAEMHRLNGNCIGCIDEAHLYGKCKDNPHRNHNFARTG